MSIPKVIHYCWFGGKPKGELIENCIESWKKILQGYKIMEWNEKNYSSESFFFRESISKKKYAFASDYARFDILKDHGGIYLDTDMLFFKPLDPLLSNHCFLGWETEQYISCGVIGAEPKDKFITAITKELEAVQSADFFEKYTIVKTVNSIYKSLQPFDPGILPEIYPIDYFYPYPYGASGDPLSYKTGNTIALHLWNASWFNDFHRSQLLYAQGRKKEARWLFFKSLLSAPKNIRFISRFFI